MDRRDFAVLQIPEVCTWNPYIGLSETYLHARGVRLLHPKLCLDGLFIRPPRPPRVDPPPDVAHLHSPEKLAAWYGPDGALAVLRDLADRGARIVQTVHSPLPNEPDPALIGYLDEVDALTSGVHFFSEEHEDRARRVRTRLPRLRTHVAHPEFPALSRFPARGRRPDGDEIVLGCFGRILPHKRYIAFGRAFGLTAREGFRLVIAGSADSSKTQESLRMLDRTYPRITYRSGFLREEEFAEMLAQVDWVALPYQRLYSSGLLVAALQTGRRILAPTPTGARAYCVSPSLEAVDPWNDAVAIKRWMEVAPQVSSALPPSVLPTWEEAADELITFYGQVVAASAPELSR